MSRLFQFVSEVQQFVVRNIVNVLPIKNAFSDLISKKEDIFIVEKAMKQIHQSLDDWEFHVTAAIEYPFASDPFMVSRYSDGSYPIWYGSKDMATTIKETVFHAIKDIHAIQNVNAHNCIKRKRKVYDVFCDGLLVDLTNTATPELLSDDYAFTQNIGKQLYAQGYSGMLAPSARCKEGINVNVFKREILSKPKTKCELNYFIYPNRQEVEVKHTNGTLVETIRW